MQGPTLLLPTALSAATAGNPAVCTGAAELEATMAAETFNSAGQADSRDAFLLALPGGKKVLNIPGRSSRQPPAGVIATAEGARDLTRTLSEYIRTLRTPLDGLRYNEPKSAPLPMMALSATAKLVEKAGRARLEGAGAGAYPQRGRDIAEAKTLLLLNVLLYENVDFLSRYFHYLDNPAPRLLLEHLADLLYYEYRLNKGDLAQGRKDNYQAVREREKTIDTYRELIPWMRSFFGEEAGVFGRRLGEHGFDRVAILFNQMEDQIRIAKRALAELEHREWLGRGRADRPAAVEQTTAQP